VIAAIEQYSAHVEERETIDCILVFQDIGDEPRSTIEPIK